MHNYVQCVYIVEAKYQIVPSKAVVGVDRPVYGQYYHKHKALELQREITPIELAPSPYFFVLSICSAYMYIFARFDENPAMTLQDIKETKRYGRTHTRTHAHTHV